MGRSDDYRRYAKECLDMANTVQDAKARASLLQMAQVWLRLAQRPVAKRQPPPILPCSLARWDGVAMLPAELLTIDPSLVRVTPRKR